LLDESLLIAGIYSSLDAVLASVIDGSAIYRSGWFELILTGMPYQSTRPPPSVTAAKSVIGATGCP
jgi:hypothetical protein